MKLSGGILAGGAGSRFGGADKGLLTYQGRPFVEHVLERLAPQVDEIVISANRSRGRYAAYGWPVVADDPATAGRGPLAGLLQLLRAARHEWLVCVPCDALDLPATFARDLADARWADESDIAVAYDGTRSHPTLCLVRRALADDLAAFLQRGGGAVWEWQARHRVAHAELGALPLNVNEPHGLAQLERRQP